MSQENIYSQTSNSQGDHGQQTLEEIKTRSETIIKQKCKDDFKLTNLQKDHRDFQKLIEEKNQQISEAEKDCRYLEDAFGQLEITRDSVNTDVNMILKSVSEYSELFNDLKKSIDNITVDYNQNENVIEDISKKVLRFVASNKNEEKLKDLDYKRKQLKDLMDSNSKLKKEQRTKLENRKIKLLKLENEEQALIEELKILQNKKEESTKEFELNNQVKEDLQKDLKLKQETYKAASEKFESQKRSNDQKLEELERNFNAQNDKIAGLKKELEELCAERKTQNYSAEQVKNEIKSLESHIREHQIKVEAQIKEESKFRQMIENLRSESFKIINEDEKITENLDQEINEINTCIDQFQFNIINDTKILDDLKHEEDLKKEEINSLKNKINDLMQDIRDSELKYTEIINEYNIEINHINTEKQDLLNKKDQLLMEKNNVSEMISDLQSKKMKCINESTEIESKRNTYINTINEEISSLRNALVVLEEDCENMKTSYDVQYQAIQLKFKEKKAEILENTNQYKERMDIIERKAEEVFKTEKNKYFEDQRKMELQISEYNAAIDNLQGELKKIIKQINSENSSSASETVVPLKNQNILQQADQMEIQIPEMANKEDEKQLDGRVFDWTTDEEEYKRTQKTKKTQPSQKSKNEKSSVKIPKKVEVAQKKKTSTKKVEIQQISSTDSDFVDWLQPPTKHEAKSNKKK